MNHERTLGCIESISQWFPVLCGINLCHLGKPEKRGGYDGEKKIKPQTKKIPTKSKKI